MKEAQSDREFSEIREFREIKESATNIYLKLSILTKLIKFPNKTPSSQHSANFLSEWC